MRGIFDPPKGGSPFGDVTISARRSTTSITKPENVYAFVNIARRRHAANTQKLEAALKRVPGREDRRRRAQFMKSQEQGMNTLLNLLYVLLSLSIDRQPVRDREHARPHRVRADT